MTENLTPVQREVLDALHRMGGSAKAADIAYKMRCSPAYVTGHLDNMHNLHAVTRGPERPFPVYTIERGPGMPDTAAAGRERRATAVKQITADLHLGRTMRALNVTADTHPLSDAAVSDAHDETLNAIRNLVAALHNYDLAITRARKAMGDTL